MKCMTHLYDTRATSHPKQAQQGNWKRLTGVVMSSFCVTIQRNLSDITCGIAQSVDVCNHDLSHNLQATMIGNKVYIFGGEDRSRRAVADLFVLDMTSLQWSKPSIEGPVPTARSAHIACAVEDRFLLIFGGGSVARCFNDVWAFDTEASTWSSLKPAGPTPSARAGRDGSSSFLSGQKVLPSCEKAKP